MGQRITVVDAFTHVAYSGNPAAVCVLGEPAKGTWMQSIAHEMNHSETAFCVPLEDERFELRWFTPTEEISLCGHATLAAAHVLWEEGWLAPQQPARFSTQSGELVATPLGRQIELDLPARPASEAPAPQGLIEALGATATWIGRNQDDYIVLVSDEADVRACAPNFQLLSTVDTRGVMITAPSSTEGIDFVSRFFAPRVGIDEDPVTGSAHCCLTPFWASRIDKPVMTARQLSARGGELEVEVIGERVKLRGSCVTTLRGTLAESAPSAASWSRSS